MARGGEAIAEQTAWALSEDAVNRWMNASKPGDRTVYAKGNRLIRTPGVDAVSQLHDEGELILNYRSAGEMGGEWIMTRRSMPQAVPPAQRVLRPLADEPERDEESSAEHRVLVILRRITAFRHPCPTNAELARLAKLNNPDQAAYQLKKLITAKLIRVETLATGFRVITVVATGRKTAAQA